MGSQVPEALSREGLFALVCDEAMKDGVLEPFERELLTRLAGFLALSAEQAREALSAAKGRFERGELGTVRPLEPGALYAKALHVVMEDGVVDDLEMELLTGVRQLLGIDDDQHRCVMAGLRSRMSRTAEPGLTDAVAAVQRPSPGLASGAAAASGPMELVLGFLTVAAAVGLVVAGLVVILGPRILPLETLRRHVDPAGDLRFGSPGMETLDPVVLVGGAPYHVGLDVAASAVDRGSFVLVPDMRLLVVDAATSLPVEVTPSSRGRSELGATVTSTLFRFVPPASGAYVLMYSVAASDAALDVDLFVTRHPALSERWFWAVGAGGCCAVLVFLAFAWARVVGRERFRRPGVRQGAAVAVEW